MTLRDFASFIKKNRFEEYAANSLRLSRKFPIPLMKLLEHLPEEQLVERSRKSAEAFLSNMEEGRLLEVARESMEKWEADELDGISKNAIHPSDLVFLYTAQRFNLLEMLPLFTSDIQVAVSIMKELEEYYSQAQDAAFQLLLKMQKEIEEALREKDKTLAQFLDGLPIGIYICDSGLNPYFTNQVAKRLFGEEIGNDKEETFRLYKAGTDERYERERLPLARALNGIHSSVDDVEVHYKGMMMPLEIWGAPVYDKNGAIIYAIVGFEDITQRRKIHEEILTKKKELERSNKELEMYASIASHDLQEPLRTITSYLELIEKRVEGLLDEETREFMDTVVDGSKRMRILITNLLEYSRITKRDTAFSEVDLNRVVEEVLDNLRNMILSTKAKISVSNELPVLHGDYYQMVQLFQNLVNNAIKFQDVNKPEIRIGSRKVGRSYEFSLRDNGIGIDPKYQHRIFEIFERLNTRDTYPGTGIGLAICKKIVERHGGDIWVDSEEGKGTTFYFTLSGN